MNMGTAFRVCRFASRVWSSVPRLLLPDSVSSRLFASIILPGAASSGPSNGRPLASIRLPQPGQDDLLAIAPHQVLYAAPGRNGSYLRQEAIPAACRAR